jgi:Fe-S cluster biogenesis protein NfuA
MSQLTLKQGIENLLLTRVPGVTSVEAAIVEPGA